MAKSVTIAGMKVIPAGFKTIVLANGETALQKKTRRRKKFKTSKATRNKLAAARRKFTVPVLTLGANAIPIVQGIDWLTNVLPSSRSAQDKGSKLFNAVVAPYVGIRMTAAGDVNFNFKELMKGLVPNIALFAIKRTGLLKGAQQKVKKASAGLISLT